MPKIAPNSRYVRCARLFASLTLFACSCTLAEQAGETQPAPSARSIAFSIDGVQYSVPKNYILNMDNWSGGPQKLVEFRITFPGFEPLTDQTRPCLEAPVDFTGKRCARQDFFVTSGYPASDEQAFENFRDVFKSQTPASGPFGFEQYYTGPDSAQIVTYRRKVGDSWLVFTCMHGADLGAPSTTEPSRAVCTRHHKLPSGNELGYHFYEGQLAVIDIKDEGIRTLIRNFQTGTE